MRVDTLTYDGGENYLFAFSHFSDFHQLEVLLYHIQQRQGHEMANKITKLIECCDSPNSSFLVLCSMSTNPMKKTDGSLYVETVSGGWCAFPHCTLGSGMNN
jgi:hypothetical protein